jgi:hypothetical protein
MSNKSRVFLIALFFFFAFGAWLLPTRAQRSNRLPDLSKRDASNLPRIIVASASADDEEDDPDLPRMLRGKVDKETYNQLRDTYTNLLRGIDPDGGNDPGIRSLAINSVATKGPRLSSSSWTALGPAPLPNGQTQQFPATTATSGRSTYVVVDPTNSNTVYLGTAQGGVWRSLDGGATWASIFDTAQSLSIGALALAPSNPSTLYVGTGEPNNSGDCFFGVGVYRIDNANGAFVLNGPINPAFTFSPGSGTITTTCFGGRAISSIQVHPTDPATIFVSTSAAVSGIGANALANTVGPLGLRGVYRSTNATSAPASVTFTKLTVNTDNSLDVPGTGNTSIFDMALEPGNPNNLLVTPSGAVTGGGVWRSTNALAATPTFTNTLFPGFNGLVMKLAINKVASVVTVYVDSNEPSTKAACTAAGNAGRVRKSIDGGVTWSAPLVAAEGYCGGQCSYDNPIAVHPANASILYIGGNARGTCSDVLKRSSDGGTTFLRDDTGLHADSHYVFFDTLNNPAMVWFVNDGGVWKRPDSIAGTAWLNENNAPLNTLQFQSLAVHPVDQNFTIGGTQDNGTEAQQTTPGNWISAESGDGGFALIDQGATNTTTVTMYHTFFNQRNNLIGFDRTNLGTCLAVKDSWEFRGTYGGQVGDPSPSCDGTAFDAPNGIVLSDVVSFYAPMALGPGTPNTLYFGTQRLYRSTNKGDTMTTVSQNPIVASTPITAIGISPQNDNVRIVGLQNGKVFATTTGSSTLTDTAFPVPTNATGSATNKYVSRAVIDPANQNTAYVTLAYYTNPATAAHVWKGTNLNTTPVWTAISGTGSNVIPNVPVNAFVVDPVNSNNLFAGTDIGVFSSTDGGTNWAPLGTGLPVVAVFDMAIAQPGTNTEILRIATHGRGMWELSIACNITCPANVTQNNDTGQCGAVVTYPAPTTTGSCTGTITCSPASGSFFPVGTTTVTCMVGASPSCTFTVTVNDTQPPTITCPPNVTATAAASCPIATSVAANFTVTASDNCPGVTIACKDQNNQPVTSGQLFPVGTTTVTCTATDTSGNTASCSFTVTAFSFCLQDDSDPTTVVLVNAQTGEYRFCCGGIIFTGRGTLVTRACVGSIDGTKGDRQVHIQWDTAANNSQGAGTAYIQKPNKTVCQITDKNMSNNTCQCGNSPPPAGPTKPPKERTL